MDYRDEALYVLTAGRLPTWPEREHWQRTLRGSRGLCVWLMVFLTLVFAYNAVTLSVNTDDWIQALTTILLMLVTGLVLLWFPVTYRHRRRTAMQTTWYDEQADKKRLQLGYTVALYGDRVVHTDLRGAVTLPYDRITSCTETLHGFYLQADSVGILIRSGDLTAQQAELIREHLQQKLAPALLSVKGNAVACLTDPLPIPCFENDDRVYSRAAVTLRQPWLVSSRRRTYLDTVKGFVIPAMIIYGTAFANTVSLTGSFLLDLVLCCCVAMPTGLLIARCLSAFGKRKVRVSLAFTRDGLAGFAQNCSYFTPWERVTLTEEKQGVRAHFSDGNSVKIPWTCMEDAEQVKQLIRR